MGLPMRLGAGPGCFECLVVHSLLVRGGAVRWLLSYFLTRPRSRDLRTSVLAHILGTALRAMNKGLGRRVL